MPFVRFSRDKRGYVYVFLVDVPGKQARGGPRVLYWFRTPPGLKVGRDAFDEDTRSALEARYPALTFDWQQIVNTPMPPAEVVTWRERRKQERAQKKAANADDGDDGPSEADSDQRVPERPEVPDERSAADIAAPAVADLAANDVRVAEPGAEPRESPRPADSDQPGARRRRRRRGGRGRRNVPASGPEVPEAQAVLEVHVDAPMPFEAGEPADKPPEDG